MRHKAEKTFFYSRILVDETTKKVSKITLQTMDTSWNSRNVARLRIFEKLYLARVARWFICME
jgi:hypothetical protein